MDFIDGLRKRKRFLEAHCFPSRRGFWIILISFFAIVYFMPYAVQLVYIPKLQRQDPLRRCIEDKLASFYVEVDECNANIRYSEDDDESYLPYVGNGFIGLSVFPQSSIFIKSARVLATPIGWHPLVTAISGKNSKEISVTHFLTGIVNRYHCFDNDLLVSYYYLAHRTIPFYFSQEIKIINPQDHNVDVYFSNQTSHMPSHLQYSRVPFGKNNEEYILITGIVSDTQAPDKGHALCILSKTIEKYMKIKPRQTLSINLPTVVFNKLISQSEYNLQKDVIKSSCYQILHHVKEKEYSSLKDEHIKVWYELWQSGFGMSHSKASDALNGDKVNATIYYALSQVRSYNHETVINDFNKVNVSPILIPQGCYGGYHPTLQAVNLWGSIKTIEEVNRIVYSWVLTLEKQGCHKLTDFGADGLLQAMLLSFGGFRFSAHHLEFTIHPKFLHRDYLFRRINYGVNTYINVNVTVQQNNKALLSVSVEGNNKTYYACDGGCIDNPVALSSEPKNFSVKQTDPITAILFISPDHMHIEDIKHTLHVKEVLEAPAHGRHIIAMHKHGHHLGGLPKLFWALVCSLIVIFHLFLFKLIYNEYCEKQDRPKPKYTKC